MVGVNPFDQAVDNVFGTGRKDASQSGLTSGTNPYDETVDSFISNAKTKISQAVMAASMQDPGQAKQNADLAERSGLPIKVVSEAPDLVKQRVKQNEMLANLAKMPKETQDYLVSNDRLGITQADLPKIQAYLDGVMGAENRERWNNLTWYERNIKNPISLGALQFVEGRNIDELRANTSAAYWGAEANKVLLDSPEDYMSWWMDNKGDMPSSVASDLREWHIRSEADRQSIVNSHRELIPQNIADAAAARQTAQDFPTDPNIPTDGSFGQVMAEIISDNPSAIPRETLKSLVASSPVIGLALMTRRLGTGATIAGSGVASYALEDPLAFAEFAQEEGYDTSDPEVLMDLFTNQDLVRELSDKAQIKAVTIGTVDTIGAGIASKILAPKAIGGRRLSTNQREGINVTAQILAQSGSEGGGEALGQYFATGEVDQASVALETLAGAGTAPADVFVYGANAYRQSKAQEQFLNNLTEKVTDLNASENITAKDIKGLAKSILHDAPVKEMQVDANRLAQMIDDKGLSLDEFLANMPDVEEQMADAMAADSYVTIGLDDYAAYISQSEINEDFIKAQRPSGESFSPSEADEWLENEARPLVEASLGDRSGKPDTPYNQIENDLVGQLIGVGFAQGPAETIAADSASQFVRIAEIVGEDPVAFYNKNIVSIRRDLGEAGRFRDPTSSLENAFDRIRAGEIPSETEAFGQTLLDFVRDKGGIFDVGGELGAMDVDVDRLPGQKNISTKDGLDPDRMAELAHEAGFIDKHDPNLLFDAIRDNLAGNPVYSPQGENLAKADLRATLLEIESQLNQAGLDLASLTNAEILAEIDRLSGNGREGSSLAQSENDNVDNTSTAEEEDAKPQYEGRAYKDAEEIRRRVQWFRTRYGYDTSASGRSITGKDVDPGFEENTRGTRRGSVGPAVFYRGHDRLIDEQAFDRDLQVETAQSPQSALGVFYTESVAEAASYGHEISGSYVDIRNPLVIPQAFFGQFLNFDNPEQARAFSEEVEAEGYDSLILEHEPDSVTGEPQPNHIVLFKPDQLIPIRSQEKFYFDRLSQSFQEADAQDLAQDRKRGEFFYDTTGKAAILLGDAADLTTVPHEMYHLFMDIMARYSDNPQIASEIEKVQGWLSRNVDDLRRDAIKEAKADGKADIAGRIERMSDEKLQEFYLNNVLSLESLPDSGPKRFLSIAGLEYWARAGEAYLREGKAPARNLLGAFARMKDWFLQVYRTAKSLRVKLDDDIRGVFDRMRASQEEIDIARQFSGFGSSLIDIEGIQWTDQEREQIARLTGEARAQAENRQFQVHLKDLEKNQQAWWEARKAEVRKEIVEQVAKEKVYVAREHMASGRRVGGDPLPDGVEQIKLDRKGLAEIFGEEYLKRLPSPKNEDNKTREWIYTRKKGVDPEIAARIFGFGSVKEMVESLINSRPTEAYIDSLVETEMSERYPDIRFSGEAAQESRSSVHNDKQSQILIAEIKKLEQQTRGTSETVPSIFRNKAKETIARMRVADLRPDGFYRKVASFSRQAIEQAASGNLEQALELKQKQLLHHYLYREAVKAKEESDKILDYAKRLQKKPSQERIGKAGGDYLERINEILTRYEFRRIPLRALERRQSLMEWVKKKEEAGEYVDIPEEVLDEARQINWRLASIGELRAVNDALKNIEHIARFKNKLLKRKDQAELTQVLDSIEERLGETQGRKKGKGFFAQKNLADKIKRGVNGYKSIALNMDTLIAELDGFEDLGPIYQAIKQPIDEAARQDKPRLEQEYGQMMVELFDKHYSQEEQRRFSKAEFMELPGRGWISRDQALAVLLNWGNDHNRQALLEGVASGYDRLEAQEIASILDSLEKKDFDFAQGVWDFLDFEVWPKVKEASKRRTGIAPEKVEADPIASKHGVYRGGYFPIRFDRELAWRVDAQQAENFAKDVITGKSTRAQTRRGFAKERTNSAQNPMILSAQLVLSSHMNDVINDLALGEAVNDVAKIIGSKRFVRMMEETGNAWAVPMIDAWLRDTAAQELHSTDVISQFAHRVRVGFTISKIGWNIGTILIQPTGLVQAVPEIGYRNLSTGMMAVMRSMGETVRGAEDNVFALVQSKSEFMKTRTVTFNKDLQDLHSNLKQSKWLEAFIERTTGSDRMAKDGSSFLKGSIMWGIVKTQQGVDTAIWLGAYEKGKGQFATDEEAIQYADNVVARTQASGIFSDRTALERGTLSQNTRQSEFVKLWTVLGSYMYAKGNLAYRKTKQTNFRNGNETMKWMHDMGLLFVFEAILIGLMRGTMPGEDDDDTIPEFIAKEAALTVMATMPFVREVGSELAGFRGGSALSGFYDELGQAGKQIDQGEWDTAMLKSINDVGGILLHYPSGQINRTAEAWWKDINGEDIEAMDYLIWRQKD